MNERRNIHAKSRYYALLKYYIDFMFKLAYRRVEYHGVESVPKDGAVIFAPNHTNTLMDALAIVAMDKQEKVFVARADIFKNPLILKFLTFLKMLPIHRKRDGMETLSRNEEVNDIVVEALQDRVPFCIFPEGTHHTVHNLMPLQKGLFRIALQANELFGEKIPLYIVPVGIEFGHYFRYRSTILVQVGEAINVTQFLKERSELSAPQQMNALRDELSDQMKKVILQIPDDANYIATSELVQLYGREQQKRMKLRGKTILNRFIAAKEIIKSVASYLQSNPQETEKILELTHDFHRERHEYRIGIESAIRPHVRWLLLGRVVYVLLGLPYFLFCLVVTAPVTLLSVWLCSKFKDRAFHNTVRYLISLAFLPVLLLLAGAVVFAFFPWEWGVAFTLLFIPSMFFLHEYLRKIRLMISDIRWLCNKDLRKQSDHIKSLITQLIT